MFWKLQTLKSTLHLNLRINTIYDTNVIWLHTHYRSDK